MNTALFALATLSCISLATAADTQKASGTWTKKAHTIKGSWSIQGNTLTLSGFSTKSAPDLKIFLSPKPVSELSNKNATTGSKLVAKLKSSKGDQTYTIPAGTEISKFKSLIIHCQKFSKLWGASAL